MMEETNGHNINEIVADFGSPKFGVYLKSNSLPAAEQFCEAGYDWLLIDCVENIDENNIQSLVECAKTANVLSFLKIGGAYDYYGMHQACNCQTQGLVIPDIDTKNDAELLMINLENSMNRETIDQLTLSLMISTRECITNLADILSRNYFKIALLDLKELINSMGLYDKYELEDIPMCLDLAEAIDEILATCKKFNVTCGICLENSNMVEPFLKKGFTFFCIGSDLQLLMTGVETDLVNAKNLVQKGYEVIPLRKIKEISYDDQGVYKGEVKWDEDKRDGEGEYVWNTGSVYIGQWKDDVIEGKGENFYTNGDSYNGNWKNGKRHGTGEFFWTSGNKYSGDWKDDLMNGQGMFTWSNGDCYNGSWVDGLREGYGLFCWQNGEKFTGNWKDDKMSGEGTIFKIDGTSEICDWVDNEMVAK